MIFLVFFPEYNLVDHSRVENKCLQTTYRSDGQSASSVLHARMRHHSYFPFGYDCLVFFFLNIFLEGKCFDASELIDK